MTVLDEAAEIIYGDGERTHGHPAKNLTVIANMWEQYLYSRGLLNTNSEGLMPQDVALMMSLLKIAILANRPDHKVSLGRTL
jgi:hypothetical protein